MKFDPLRFAEPVLGPAQGRTRGQITSPLLDQGDRIWNSRCFEPQPCSLPGLNTRKGEGDAVTAFRVGAGSCMQ
jgi:hypothetical protein